MTTTTFLTNRTKETVLALIIILSFFGLLFYGDAELARSASEKAKKRTAIICPSLLSIGRSSRDTLIVMKNEPLCQAYVLDNLK